MRAPGAQQIGSRTPTAAGLPDRSQASTALDIYAHAFDKKKREAQKKLGQVMGL